MWPGEDGGESGGEQVEEEEKEEKREIATGGGHNMEREENYQKEVREWSWWKNHFDEGRYKRSEDNVQAMVWLFAPIRKSLKCLLVIVIIFGFVSDCFLNLCFLQVDILQKLFPQKSKVGDSTQISDQYGTITCYTFLPHNNFLIQNTFLIHTKSWNRTFFFCYATGTGRKLFLQNTSFYTIRYCFATFYYK